MARGPSLRNHGHWLQRHPVYLQRERSACRIRRCHHTHLLWEVCARGWHLERDAERSPGFDSSRKRRKVLQVSTHFSHRAGRLSGEHICAVASANGQYRRIVKSRFQKTLRSERLLHFLGGKHAFPVRHHLDRTTHGKCAAGNAAVALTAPNVYFVVVGYVTPFCKAKRTRSPDKRLHAWRFYAHAHGATIHGNRHLHPRFPQSPARVIGRRIKVD